LLCLLRAGILALPMAVVVFYVRAQAQNEPMGVLLNPTVGGAPLQFRLNGPTESAGTSLGQLQGLTHPPGFGAGNTGFDSTNAAKKRKAKTDNKTGNKTVKPGSPAGSPAPSTAASKPAAPSDPSQQGAVSPKLLQPTGNPPVWRVLLPHRPGAPPADPVLLTPTIATTPPAWRPPPEEKPFDPLGIQAGGFNLRSGIDYFRGYDTNPTRASLPPMSGSWMNVYAPELLLTTNWPRHDINGYFRGAYLTYDTVHQYDRPYGDGKLNGRIDINRDSRIDLESRLIIGTDRPGSPNIQADVSHLPIFTTVGASAGVGQRFNRLEVTVKGGVDRTSFQESHFLNGLSESNDDRNYNQYSGQMRTSYEVLPGVKPFVEVGTYKRVHDLFVDRFGFERDSLAVSGKVGSSFEFSRKLTGEASVGYLTEKFQDPNLPKVSGTLIDAALLWSATALTTARLFAVTTVYESPLAGVSAVLTRTVGVQVDHAFRRWLIGIVRFAEAHDEYIPSVRNDYRYSVSVGLTYMATRDLQFKGEFRQEWLRSNLPFSNSVASVWLFGVRLQH
jgi:hypothetical protein